MSDESAARTLLDFLTDVGDAPDVIWSAALAHLERALNDAKEASHGRFRHYPEGQLRKLREGTAQSMKLARLAVAMLEAEREQTRELDEELRERAEEAARAAGRAQTLPAQLARLEKQRRRKLGLSSENFHLRADYPRDGLRAKRGDGAGDRDG